MAEEKIVFEENLKHKGLFTYSELYNYCYNWFKNEEYLLSEEEYTEKVSGGKEIIIKWKAKKKITDYYQYIIDVKWHILGMSEVEVDDASGKKIKTNKGEVKLSVKASVKRDYEETWDKHPFYKFLRGVYDKYIMRTTNEEYEDTLTAKTETFIEDTKAFLNLEGKK